jgi:serine/threonine-protein phosphatase 2A activator
VIQSIQSKKISDTPEIAKFNIFKPLFAKLEQILVETPPIQQPMRYGNKAFKDWHEKACKEVENFLN